MAVAADLAPKLNSAKEHIQWLDSVSGAASDVAAAQEQLSHHQGAFEEAQPDLVILATGEDAEPLRVSFESALHARLVHENCLTEISTLESAIGDSGEHLRQTTWLAVLSSEEVASGLQQKLTDIDGQIEGHNHHLSSIQGGSQLSENLRSWRERAGQLDQALARLDTAKQFLTRAQDELGDSVGGLSAIQEATLQVTTLEETAVAEASEARTAYESALGSNTLEDLRESKDKLRDRLAGLKALRPIGISLAQHAEQLLANRTVLGGAEADLAELTEATSEARAELERDEERVADKERLFEQEALIKNLSQHRDELEEGKECPLCGSREHPLVQAYKDLDATATQQALDQSKLGLRSTQAKIVQLDRKSAIATERATTAKLGIAQLLRSEEELRQQWDDGQSKWSIEVSEVETLDEAIQLVDAQVTKASGDYKRADGLRQASESAASAVRDAIGKSQLAKESLTSAKAKIEQHKKVVSEREAGVTERLRESDLCRDALLEILPDNQLPESLNDWLSAREADLTSYRSLQQQLIDLDQLRTQTNGDLSRAVSSRAAWKSSWATGNWPEPEELATSGQDLAALEVLVGRLKDRIIELGGELKRARTQSSEAEAAASSSEDGFQERLKASPFGSIDAFREGLLAPDVLSSLRQLKQTLHGAVEQARLVVQERLRRHAALLAEAKTDIAREVLAEQLNGLEEQARIASEQVGRLLEQLEADNSSRQRIAQFQEEIETARLEHTDWQHLNGLIGSADGDKFRRFAQGLTLDHLIHLANQHLHRLDGGRYRLERETKGLELVVVDCWQADAQRDVRTLSGGESFLVSLALALGLSDLVSHQTSIDSFFLDEGFGTLDPESLDVALDAIDRLNQSGKLIGVISHVELVKERIPVQIRVIKGKGQGNSRVELPAHV
ncbi:MAG: SbcC/MukB-like Walker B domain-containing protein, partial [Pseudoxanthomonas sp.]